MTREDVYGLISLLGILAIAALIVGLLWLGVVVISVLG